MKILKAALGLMAVLAAPAGAQTLAPSSEWQFVEDEENCRIGRAFGTGEERTIVQIQSYGSQTPYQFVAQGSVFPIRDSRAVIAEVDFGGEREAQEVMAVLGKSGNRPLLRFAIEPPRPTHIMGRLYSYQPMSMTLAATIDPAAEQLVIDMPDMTPVTLQLGPMTEQFARLDRCAEGLAFKRGDTFHRTAQAPEPLGFDELIYRIKYPQNLLLNRISGIVFLRTTVGADGRIRDCVVQAPDWGDRFERDTCRTLEQYGRFEPARDEQGNAVEAPFATAVFFIIYNW